jgi:uncharacterized Zn finger protein
VEDISALAQRLAGQNAFEKGSVLYASGQVQNFQFSENNIRAQVQGSELYQVDLTRTGESIDGGCNCPASEGFDFCKHCVATLLMYGERLSSFEEMRNGPPALRVSAHIENLSEKQAKENLFQIISQSPDLLEKWLLIADVTSEKLSPKDLKKHFTKALPLRDIWRHDKVRAYFEGAFQSLTHLFKVITILAPQPRFDLCEFTLHRYDKILERLDDSGGYRFSVFTLLERQYSKTFQALQWTAETKADYLVGLYNAPFNHLSFDSIPSKFIAQGDSKTEHVFFEKLKKAIDYKIGRIANTKTSENIVIKKMTKQLIAFYLTQQQFKPALYYSTQLASTIDDYFEIIALALEAQEYEIAHEYIQISQQKVRMQEDKIKVEKFALSLAVKRGHDAETLAHAWNIFEITLSIDDYIYLESLNANLKKDRETLIAKAEKALLTFVKANGKNKKSSGSMRAIENLVEFYLHNEQTDKALALARQYDLAPDTLHDVAFSSMQKRPKASFNLYRQLCLLYPQMGTQKDYETCIDLLKELDRSLATNATMSEKFNHLLAELADIFRYKEAFIDLLDNAFPNTRPS